MSTAFYFAYGSNADPERLAARVGPWRTRRRATLADHRLRFAGSVRSEGGGGAVVDPFPGASVDGVLYELSEAQLESLDRVEFAPERDSTQRGRRAVVTVTTADGPVEAALYTLDDDPGDELAPSDRYLDHILRGLADAGHDESALDRVRAAAARARR